MSKPTPNLVHVIQNQKQKAASRSHTQFHNLIKKIDRQKHQLAAWVEAESLYRGKVAEDYLPLLETYAAVKADLARLLDRAHDDSRCTRREREKLSHLIITMTGELLEEHDLEAVKPLYDKHNAVDFDTEQQAIEAQQSLLMRSMMESHLGMQFDEDQDLGSPEKIAEALEKKMRETRAANEERHRQAEARRAKRPKSAKQQEKEALKEAEKQHISQSIQAIYRKLVTELHPDREPDPAERERKTTLMQAVNVAYEKRDLLQLLELQLTLEQIDPDHLGSLTEERIKHYNKVLREQSGELQVELMELEHRIRMQMNLPPFGRLVPEDVLKHLKRDISHLKSDIRSLRKDLESLADFAALKAWLKGYKIPKRQPLEESYADLLFPSPWF